MSLLTRRILLHYGLGCASLPLVSSIASLTSAQAQPTAFDMDLALAPRYEGSADAPILLAEYFSLTCSHCASFHANTYPSLKAEWIDTGRVRLEYRDFPIDGLSVYAHALVRALPVTAYSNMLGILFARQREWVTASQPLLELQKIFRLAGMGSDSFNRVIDNRPLQRGIVDKAQAAQRRFGIRATPSFVINNRQVLAGNLSYTELAGHLADI